MADLSSAPVVVARTQVEAEGWQAAIRAACQPLVEACAVEPRYVDRSIRMVEEHGPYVVLAPGIALAHARPEDGVRQLCLAAATLAQAVPFGHPDNDPVDLVFAFGSPDSNQHVALLRALANGLQGDLAEDLRSAVDADDAQELLEAVVADVRE